MMVAPPHRECGTGQERSICATTPLMQRPAPLHVSLVAIPDAVVSTLSGIFDVLALEPSLPTDPPFVIEIVGEKRGSVTLASGIPVHARRAASEVEQTDIIIVPSVLLEPGGWVTGRYPEIVDWARRKHADGALWRARESFSSPKPGSSTDRTRRSIGATHESSSVHSHLSRLVPSACWLFRVPVRS